MKRRNKACDEVRRRRGGKKTKNVMPKPVIGYDIYLLSSKLIPLISSLMLFSRILFGLISGRRLRGFPAKFCMYVTYFHAINQLVPRSVLHFAIITVL
jgi:ABC-type tungstate transport system substrate-binding protein